MSFGVSSLQKSSSRVVSRSWSERAARTEKGRERRSGSVDTFTPSAGFTAGAEEPRPVKKMALWASAGAALGALAGVLLPGVGAAGVLAMTVLSASGGAILADGVEKYEVPNKFPPYDPGGLVNPMWDRDWR